jgi:hypothetical protein
MILKPGHCCIPPAPMYLDVIHPWVVPKYEVGCLAFLPRIRKLWGSNLGLEIGYPDWSFYCFTQSVQANARIVPWINPRPLPLPSHLVMWHYIGLIVAVEASLSKPRIKQLHLKNTSHSICSGLAPTTHTYTGVTGHHMNQWMDSNVMLPVRGVNLCMK